jgi:hypothetical protein
LGVGLHGARRAFLTPRLPGRFQENITGMLPSPQRTQGGIMEISAQQLAELLIGIARAQAAIVHGLETEFAGVRSGRVVPALQNVAHLRDHPEPTLVDLPVRVLLTSMGRVVGPDADAVAKDLERLCAAKNP